MLLLLLFFLKAKFFTMKKRGHVGKHNEKEYKPLNHQPLTFEHISSQSPLYSNVRLTSLVNG